jgi:hypothetical protein
MTPQQAIHAANRFLNEGNKVLAVEFFRHALMGVPDQVQARIAINRLKELGAEPPPPTRRRRSPGEGVRPGPELRAALADVIRPVLSGLGSPPPKSCHRKIAEQLELPPPLVHRVIADILGIARPSKPRKIDAPPVGRPPAPKPFRPRHQRRQQGGGGRGGRGGGGGGGYGGRGGGGGGYGGRGGGGYGGRGGGGGGYGGRGGGGYGGRGGGGGGRDRF